MFTACQKEENIAPNAFESTLSGGRAEDQPAIKLKNGRLCFADRNALYQTIELLNKQQNEGLDAWEKGKGFSSLRNWQKTVAKKDKKSEYEQEMIDFSFPQTMAAIINPDGEYQIGDTVVLYSKNYVYYIPAQDEKQVKLAKTAPEQLRNVRKFALSMKVLDNKVASDGRVEDTYMSANSINTKYQFPYQVYTSSDVINYKIVYEVYCWHDNNVSFVRLRIKLQNKPFWSSAYTESGVSWTTSFSPLSYSTLCFNNNVYESGMKVLGTVSSSGAYEIPLGYTPMYTNGQVDWRVRVSGNINMVVPEHNQSYSTNVDW
ncbi:MAG: hypothetical protein EAZ97_13805 [Bacteroidetes bacterium]|nr:MAG: hypothetical protein EAZ97_13805 [Bacteroidota bacterium]